MGDAEELPFDDDKFDVYTIAFGIRNVTHIDRVRVAASSASSTQGISSPGVAESVNKEGESLLWAQLLS